MIKQKIFIGAKTLVRVEMDGGLDYTTIFIFFPIFYFCWQRKKKDI
jgi:hypothetical protein